MPITRSYIPTIKSIQRGESTIATTATSLVVTVSSVNMAKSRLSLLGTRSNNSSTNGVSDLGTIALTSPTQITLARTGTSTPTLTMSWELTEYN